MTLSFLCLILPRFVDSAPGGAASPLVYAFLVIASVVLYGIFLFQQSTRHRIFFLQLGVDEEESGAHGHDSPHSSFYHAAFLILTLLPIVLLSKKSRPFAGLRVGNTQGAWRVGWFRRCSIGVFSGGARRLQSPL